jgi:hypothetical protein
VELTPIVGTARAELSLGDLVRGNAVVETGSLSEEGPVEWSGSASMSTLRLNLGG